MTTTVRLTEWSTTSRLSLTSAQRDALRSRLAVAVQPSVGSSDLYDLTPGNTIGALSIDDTTFLIEPKIPIDRVMFLLGYLADPTDWSDNAHLGDAPGIVDGVVGLFARLVEAAFERGLLAGYHEVQDTLPTVRGRIGLAEQLRRRPGLSAPLALSFSEHDHDVSENQLILGAASLLRRLPLRDLRNRRSLRRIADVLEAITPVRYHPARIPEITWTRLNSHYRAAVELARLILRHQSPEVTEGSYQVMAFTIDMATLFEEFVRTALRDAAELNPESFPKGADCTPLHLDTARRTRLEPDLSLWRGRCCEFIGDVKYKRDSGSGQNADLYQLLAYATATNLPDATLVYAYGPAAPTTLVVKHAGVRLHVHHVDLAQPPERLLGSVAQLADSLGLRDDRSARQHAS